MSRTKFPHLLTPDVPVWERWLNTHRDQYLSIEYDVRVGSGRDPGPDFDSTMRKMALDLSKRRIDALLETDSGIICVEITTSAGLTALGQCLAYPILYKLTYHPEKPVSPLLVCAEVQPDLTPVFSALRVPVNIA